MTQETSLRVSPPRAASSPVSWGHLICPSSPARTESVTVTYLPSPKHHSHQIMNSFAVKPPLNSIPSSYSRLPQSSLPKTQIRSFYTSPFLFNTFMAHHALQKIGQVSHPRSPALLCMALKPLHTVPLPGPLFSAQHPPTQHPLRASSMLPVP